MTYAEYEQNIEELAIKASDDSRRNFAIDSILLLRRSVESILNDDLNVREQDLLAALIRDLEIQPPDNLGAILNELDKSTSQDPVRGIELSRDLVELFCAIDHWIKYRQTSNPHWIARLAINVVNHVDDSTDHGLALSDIFAEPRMVAEFQRQRTRLAPS